MTRAKIYILGDKEIIHQAEYERPLFDVKIENNVTILYEGKGMPLIIAPSDRIIVEIS